MTAPTGLTEQERLQALWATGLLDTPPDPAFERLVSLACRITTAPIAMISLIDKDRQWLKACSGLETREMPRGQAFCHHTVQAGAPMVVLDAAADPRFRDNPLVEGDAGIRFYAGAPIFLSGGAAIGAVCVLDRTPRNAFDDEVMEGLKALAEIARDQIEAAEHQRTRDVTIAELQHRLSNAFTQMVALVQLTRHVGETKEEYMSELQRRIVQLDQVNRRLANGAWKRGTVRTVIEAALGPISDDSLDRLKVTGEDLEVEGPLAMAVSMAIYELTTNSLKHGVLAGATGRPQINLTKKDGHFTFEWLEPVAAHAPKPTGPGTGFGSILLLRLLPAEVNGRADYKVSKLGVRYRLTAPVGETA